MAQVSSQNPQDRLANYISSLEQRIKQLEDDQARGVTYRDGTRVRVRIGLQSDGKYGLRIWNAAGVLQIDQTY